MINNQTENIIERPPVVVIMGHIDHGKSTLLDFIRNSDVVSGEAGHITQHLGAYEVEREKDGITKKITFIDTPGHEAFKSVRGRGAEVADVAILIISAEDGVMPQTLEALEIIKSKKIPFIVALNKIDAPGADIEKSKNSLIENEIYIEGYGGSIPCVEISALSGKNVDELLDLILLSAEIEEFKGDLNSCADGFVIEAHKDKFTGITTTLIIKNGTLRVGDFITSCDAYSPIRQIKDFKNNPMNQASFSTPISISGWNKIPKVGYRFYTTDCKKTAEKDCEQFKLGDAKNTGPKKNSIRNKKVDEFLVPIIIKADTDGSLEAVLYELKKVELLNKENNAQTKIILTGTGNISENDIKLASGNKDTIIVGFGVNVDKRAEIMAERLGIKNKTFDIIYEMTDWLKETIEENRPRMEVEEKRGLAKVLKIFNKVHNHQILGCRILDGVVKINKKFKIRRRGEEIGFGIVKGLQQQKSVVTEVSGDTEFGTSVDSRIEMFPGDEIEIYEVVKK